MKENNHFSKLINTNDSHVVILQYNEQWVGLNFKISRSELEKQKKSECSGRFQIRLI